MTSDGSAVQNSGSTSFKAERVMPHAGVALSPEMHLRGGIASLSPAERSAVAARAAAALMQRANVACDAPLLRSVPRAKEVAGAGQHDWAPADWTIAESMVDTVDSFCLDSDMGSMDGDGFDFHCASEGPGFEAGWLPGEGKYASAYGPISAADFGGADGGFGSSFEPGSLHGKSFAVPDITAAGPRHQAYSSLPAGFLSDTRFPMPMSPELPLAYGGLSAAAAGHLGSAAVTALRSNSGGAPARVPSLMVINVPVCCDEPADDPACKDGPGSPDDGRSQRLSARAARAARRAAADSDVSDGRHPGERGAQPELLH